MAGIEPKVGEIHIRSYCTDTSSRLTSIVIPSFHNYCATIYFSMIVDESPFSNKEQDTTIDTNEEDNSVSTNGESISVDKNHKTNKLM